MIQDIFIIGATGKVGKTLVRQIFENADTEARFHPNPTRVIGLASSKNYIFSQKGLSKSMSYEFAEKRLPDSRPYNNLNELLKIASGNRQENDSTLAFVDVTALNKPMIDFHLKIINETPFGIVTANKNPIALSDYDVFVKLTKKPRRYGYRCSVMAGAEAVSMLRDLKDVNDVPKTIQGCFSGTLGFITSELEKGRKFSDIIKDAKEKGYTEPDPRDDLNGLDVARKLIVLARTVGFPIGLENIELKPFIPEKYFSEQDIDSFLESTKELDDEFEQKVLDAKSKNKVLRYVANLDATKEIPKLDVSLKEIPLDSPLGSLKGTLNKIVIISNAYPEESPYSVEAPGAGLQVTAQNIRRDLLYLLKGRETKIR